ncbi:DUF1553 domain-containing protein [Kriegella aquimaris]|uniref:Planctomycete cytochrome C n=1 Tax=Kriegella aquimaris TaxID=192904 RepID=A0A1G9YGX2_9FLAO|nr:DUF1553 domain-containing protein [Kriegella aquimaris]SDN08428.1 Planctomycete cytochrome C [Kriegella aquimaris]
MIFRIQYAHSIYISALAAGLIILIAGCNSVEPNDKFSALGSSEMFGTVPDTIDFNLHIKPVLSDRCFSCHGPDQNALKADLRLDLEEGALRKKLKSGGHAFVSGNIGKSEAFSRITSTNDEEKMPPAESGLILSAREVAMIAKWIDQGAEYKPHWAFIPPKAPRLPKVKMTNWVQNPIDKFILKKLESVGLEPNLSASKETLLRRVSFDLTGLPPTIAEIDAFIADKTPDAFEKVVDRLLNSPHYGDRMALEWLDVARYADSNGYSQDGLRTMWPWRDWLITAFNKNMPYDQFITWQVAGDKLPNATSEQRMATGFLRNNRLNGEGGIVDEEYRVEYVMDRTETVATSLMGMTMQCARCHDHKYDPISQEEYFEMFAFFNSANESGIAQNDGNSGPQLLLATPAVEKEIEHIETRIASLQDSLKILLEKPLTIAELPNKINLAPIIDIDFDGGKSHFTNKANTKSIINSDKDVMTEPHNNGSAVKFTGFDGVHIQSKSIDFDRADQFSFSFWFKSDHEGQQTTVLNHMSGGGTSFKGYDISVIDDMLTLRLIRAWPAHLISVRAPKPIVQNEWAHYVFTYDGSSKAKGVQVYVNGKVVEKSIGLDRLNQNISNGQKRLSIGGRPGYLSEVKGGGSIDDLKVFAKELSAAEVNVLYSEASSKPLVVPDEMLKKHYLLNYGKEVMAVREMIDQLGKRRNTMQDTLMGVMVMEDLPEPRTTYILERGGYEEKGKQVYPNTPKALMGFADSLPKNRLGLTQWLVDKKNPLTARVIVNRFWKMYFGQGIVKTVEDFGNQGSLPSHPELLDWLALEFMNSGWDIKAFQKLIVMSATYRQSSRATESTRKNDPSNMLLARGPSTRLGAEFIRDCALSASGLLNLDIGGASVKPYQPAGLWSEKGEFSVLKNYEQDHGEKLYRRGLYTFWRRTSPLPSMSLFDAPNRDNCTVIRQQTNTPMQALVLMNDPQFVEAARVLSERVIRENSNKKDQILHAHRLLTGRRPNDEVLTLLIELEQETREKFSSNTDLVKELLAVGEHPVAIELPALEVAAMTVVNNTLLSLDETIMKR